jgi:GTP-binding protein
MEITQAEFVGGYPRVTLCPEDSKPEYAFIGRSNVGKSSLINMLCKRSNLAQTSKSPGNTQSINYYIINKPWYLVDLPGYGYAKVSQRMRQKWRQMIEGYILKRPTLFCVFVLVDCNIPPQEIDLEFIDWLGQMKIPFALLFTKVDRLNPEEVDANISRFREKMLETWEEMPHYFVTSSHKNTGRVEVLSYLDELNTRFFEFYEE